MAANHSPNVHRAKSYQHDVPSAVNGSNKGYSSSSNPYRMYLDLNPETDKTKDKSTNGYKTGKETSHADVERKHSSSKYKTNKSKDGKDDYDLDFKKDDNVFWKDPEKEAKLKRDFYINHIKVTEDEYNRYLDKENIREKSLLRRSSPEDEIRDNARKYYEQNKSKKNNKTVSEIFSKRAHGVDSSASKSAEKPQVQRHKSESNAAKPATDIKRKPSILKDTTDYAPVYKNRHPSYMRNGDEEKPPKSDVTKKTEVYFSDSYKKPALSTSPKTIEAAVPKYDYQYELPTYYKGTRSPSKSPERQVSKTDTKEKKSFLDKHSNNHNGASRQSVSPVSFTIQYKDPIQRSKSPERFIFKESHASERNRSPERQYNKYSDTPEKKLSTDSFFNKYTSEKHRSPERYPTKYSSNTEKKTHSTNGSYKFGDNFDKKVSSPGGYSSSYSPPETSRSPERYSYKYSDTFEKKVSTDRYNDKYDYKTKPKVQSPVSFSDTSLRSSPDRNKPLSSPEYRKSTATSYNDSYRKSPSSPYSKKSYFADDEENKNSDDVFLSDSSRISSPDSKPHYPEIIPGKKSTSVYISDSFRNSSSPTRIYGNKSASVNFVGSMLNEGRPDSYARGLKFADDEDDVVKDARTADLMKLYHSSNHVSSGYDSPTITPSRVAWSYSKKGVLINEVVEGQPCDNCPEVCPGFRQHPWRKTCQACKCSRETHAVYQEEWADVRARLGLVAPATQWSPPGLPPAKVEAFMRAAGGGYTAERARKLAHQLPRQDLSASHCRHLEPQHKASYEDFIAARNEIALDIGFAKENNDLPSECPTCHLTVKLGDLAVVATRVGENYLFHPSCFTCTTCGELLADLAYCALDDRPYCERHYAEMLKPRCSACDELIFSGEYTKAMNKDWHSGHFCCWQCDESLTGQRYVLRDDHPYCIKCYESVFANGCEECNKTIGIDSKDLSYKDKHWHEACFLCAKCRVSLVDKQFGSKIDKIYCGNCYDAQFASRCDGCGEVFRAGTKKMEYKTRQWHEKCFCCVVCKTPIGTKSFIPREQEIYCAGCYEEKFATRCVKCNKIITQGGVTYKNEPWHRECFTCTNCSTSLAGQRFTSRDDKPYCAECFGELFAKRCTSCVKPITGIGGTRFISFEDRHWHNDCFICALCKTSLVGRGFITDAQDIICPECAKQKLM